MQINKFDLVSSAVKLGVSEKTAEELWNTLEDNSNSYRFEVSRVLYYLGALIVIVALGWFANLAWMHFTGKGLFTISLSYLVVFFALGNSLWHKKGLKVPGGLFITLAVGMVPMAVYGFQKWTGFWLHSKGLGTYSSLFDWLKGETFTLLVATIFTGYIAIKFYRFPFLIMPILIASLFMFLDLGLTLFENNNLIEEWVCVGFGIIVLIAAYCMDIFLPEDFAFWSYLIGLLSFWWGITVLSQSYLGLSTYLIINLFLIFLAVILQRPVFLVFGGIGILVYLTSLYERYFADSTLFPAALSLMGMLVVFAGIAYQKNRQKIDSAIRHLLPKTILDRLPNSNKHQKM
jgi:hypothetical protein